MGNTFNPMSLFMPQAQPTTADYTRQPLVAPQFQGTFNSPASGMIPGGPGEGYGSYGYAPGMSNYASMIQQAIAPYQGIAQRMESPYATMSPNSWLAQNHPGVAGVLDNSLLAASQVRPSQTPGEAISSVAGSLTGANQYRRQQMLQTQMLPYELAQPGIDMAYKMSQIQHNADYSRQVDASMLRANAYSMGQGALADSRMAMRPTGKQFQGPNGQLLSEVVDPGTGRTEMYDPTSQQIVSDPNITSNLKPFSATTPQTPAPFGRSPFALSWTTQHAPEGANGQYSPQQGAQFQQDLEAFNRQNATGVSTGHNQGEQPTKTADQLISEAEAGVKQLGQEPSATMPKDWPTANAQAYGRYNIGNTEYQRDVVNEYAQRLQAYQKRVSDYTASGAAKQGIPFATWRWQQGDRPGQTAPAAQQGTKPPGW